MANESKETAAMNMIRKIAESPMPATQKLTEAIEIIAAHFGIDQDEGEVHFY